MAGIYESANGWVSTLINNAISKIKTDQTILCTVINNDAASIGKYTVSYNAVSFEAYTESNQRYKINDNVYVLIPQGDYNEQKIILCKKF